MANQVKGGPNAESITTAMKNGAKSHSLTLRFTEKEDLDLYLALTADAKADRRSLDQFVVLYLLANYPHNEVAEQKSTVE